MKKLLKTTMIALAFSLSFGAFVGAKAANKKVAVDVSAKEAPKRVSDLAGLKAALVGANENTEIIVEGKIAITGDDVIDGKGATIRHERPACNPDGYFIGESATPKNHVFEIDGNHTVTLKNMTVMGGYTTTESYGAIYSKRYSDLTLQNVAVTRSWCGLYVEWDSKLLIEDSNFSRNIFTGNGAGIWVSESKVIMNRVRVVENRSKAAGGYGGAISIQGGSAYLNNCLIANNTSEGKTAGVFICDTTDPCDVYFVNCSITGNATTMKNEGSYQYGGGIFAHGSMYDVDVQLINSIVAANYTNLTNHGTGPEDPYDRSDIVCTNIKRFVMRNTVYSVVPTLTFKGAGAPEYNANNEQNDVNEYALYRYDYLMKYEKTSSGKFGRPEILKKGVAKNGLDFFTPMVGGGTAETYAVKTYMSYTSVDDVRIGYDNSGSISYVVGDSGLTESNLVTQYVSNDADRDPVDPISGACGYLDSEATYTVLTISYREELGNPHGYVKGASIYGDAYPVGTTFDIEAVPDKRCLFNYWYDPKSLIPSTTVTTAVRTYTAGANNAFISMVCEQGKTVIYDANGGTGEAEETVKSGTEITVITGEGFAKEGCTFDGWNSKADGSGTNYAPGAKIEMNDDITLYAKWKSNSDPTPTPDPSSGDKPSKSGIGAGGVIGIVLGSIVLLAGGAYLVGFFAINKWIIVDGKAIRVFRFGSKDGKERVISYKFKVYTKEAGEVYKSKSEALK